MDTRKQNSPKVQKPDRTPIIVAFLAAIPPLLLAIDKLIQTGRALGWW